MLIKEEARQDSPLSNWSWLCAGVLVMQIFTLSSLPFELFEPWDKLFHVLAYSALTLLLWIATDGRRPLLVVAGVMMLGMLDEFRQAAIPTRTADVFDFLADALAAGITGAALFWTTGKSGAKSPCAESSQR
jgi:VanZ family protein